MKNACWLVVALCLVGCGGEGGDSAGSNVEITNCYLGDQFITLDGEGHVISSRPISETEVVASEEEGRLLLWKMDGTLIAQCGSDVTISESSQSESSTENYNDADRPL